MTDDSRQAHKVNPLSPAFPHTGDNAGSRGIPVRLYLAGLVAAQLALDSTPYDDDEDDPFDYMGADTIMLPNERQISTPYMDAEAIADMSLSIADMLVQRHNETS